MDVYGSGLDEWKDDLKVVKGNRVLLAMFVAVVVLVVLVLLGYLGWGLFSKAELFGAGNPMSVSTLTSSVPSDMNSWKSRAPGLGDRLRGQEFSGTNQGGPTNNSLISTQYNNGSMQGLVSGRGEPDFWEISSLLGEYQTQGAINEGGGYWSPDLQAWLSEDEVAALPAEQRNNVQYYSSTSAKIAAQAAAAQAAQASASPQAPAQVVAAPAVAAPAPVSAAAAAEYFAKMRSVNKYLGEGFATNYNKNLSPEERMMAENFGPLAEYRPSAERFSTVDGDLAQRLGAY